MFENFSSRWHIWLLVGLVFYAAGGVNRVRRQFRDHVSIAEAVQMAVGRDARFDIVAVRRPGRFSGMGIGRSRVVCGVASSRRGSTPAAVVIHRWPSSYDPFVYTPANPRGVFTGNGGAPTAGPGVLALCAKARAEAAARPPSHLVRWLWSVTLY